MASAILRRGVSLLSTPGSSVLRASCRYASSYVMNVTQSDFEEKVLKSDKPVVVDFMATW